MRCFSDPHVPNSVFNSILNVFNVSLLKSHLPDQRLACVLSWNLICACYCAYSLRDIQARLYSSANRAVSYGGSAFPDRMELSETGDEDSSTFLTPWGQGQELTPD